VTWYPNRRRPCLDDYHDASPEIWNWVSGRWEPPHHGDGRDLRTIARSILKQCRANAARANKKKTPR
jgi:hypothetical protein